MNYNLSQCFHRFAEFGNAFSAVMMAKCKTDFKDEMTDALVNGPAFTRRVKAADTEYTLIMWKLHCLARSLRDLICMLAELKKGDIKFVFLSEAIDTESPIDCAIWKMAAMLAKLERLLIADRTRVGLKAVQRRGVKFGQKPKLMPDRLANTRNLINQYNIVTRVATIMGMCRATPYSALQYSARIMAGAQYLNVDIKLGHSA